MTLLSTLFIFGAAALGFFLLADGITYLIANTGDRGKSRTNRRLQSATLSEAAARAFGIQEASAARTAADRHIDALLSRAGVGHHIYRVYAVMAVAALATFAALAYLVPAVPRTLLGVIAIAAGAALPILYLRRKAKARLDRFQSQFPDALDLIVRSLRIGHPLSVALATIGDEIPEPLGLEFAIAAQQVAYGKSTAQAIEGIAERIPLADVRFFVVAVQIHHESGGNLAEILAGLSAVIRGRFQLFRKVKALTVEGRFSAWFLSIFPVVMIFAMNWLQPGYYQKVSDFAYFTHLVLLTFAMLVINVIAVRMMVKLEV